MAWTVRAFVYSGRPDPRWELDDAQAQAFLRRWDALPIASLPPDQAPPPPTQLGYRGVLVTAPNGDAWFAANGLIRQTAAGGSETRMDDKQALEHWVLRTVPPSVGLPPGG